MTEEQLRALVRDAVARHLGQSAAPDASDAVDASRVPVSRHASHGMFRLQAGNDGACLIEPAVSCTHCGYCKSYGH